MNMKVRPKFSSCNAPVFQPDPICKLRTHYHGEEICFYMNELVQPNSYQCFIDKHRARIYDAIANGLEPILDAYGSIRRRLQRAKKTPSILSTNKD